VIAAVAFALAVAGAPRGSSPPADEVPSKTRPMPGRAVLTVMDEVVERLLPKLLDSPKDTAHRVAIKGGLFGIGAWLPPGGVDYGASAPPLHLFPSAGLGQSLNVDPITGRSYFGPP
jgi:hypothetical protein